MRAFLLFLLAGLLAGCGSSSDLNSPSGAQANPPSSSLSALITTANGGGLSHPAGHEFVIEAGALTADTLASLSLLNTDLIKPRNEQEFDPVGQGIVVDLAGVKLDGKATFTIPFSTNRPEQHEVYLLLEDDLLYPLPTDFDPAQQEFTGILDLSGDDPLPKALEVRLQVRSSQIGIILVDVGNYLGRPPHVDWLSYNLYVFRGGSFVKIVDQGVELAPIPDPGSKPLMLVHGLGSNIPRFQDAATYFAAQGQFSEIFGFEYDTLSGIATSGPKLNLAYQKLEQNPERSWSHLAHSMGTLISRTAFENGTPPPYARADVVLAAGPHLGSPVINKLQGSLSLFNRFVRYLVVNQVMDFRNADGQLCQVSIDDVGFGDLAVGSAALARLNDGAANNHPEETYFTVAGNAPGFVLLMGNYLLGVYPEDGLVPLASANPGSLIGAAQSDVVAASHLTIVDDTKVALPLILSRLLGR
jgi:hypothetical protein